MSDPFYLSVVIPAYNEEANIEATLADVGRYLASKPWSSEVIVVDDGSTDRTAELVSTVSMVKLLRNVENRGKGFAVRKGMREARGTYRLFMDADGATAIVNFDAFLPHLEAGKEVVVGSRKIRGSQITVPQPILRRVLSRCYHLLSRLVAGGIPVSDYNCGFKAFQAAAAEALFSRQKMDDWTFDTELFYLAKRLRLSVQEVPVAWAHKATTKVRALGASIRSFKSLWAIRMQRYEF